MSEVDYAKAFSNSNREAEQRQLDKALGDLLLIMDSCPKRNEVFRAVDELSIDRSDWFRTELRLYAEMALFIREGARLEGGEKARRCAE